ncbi:PQQ-binding-like beta-propeller repeat protein [Mycolicibacterium sediminis]|uniref:outer membrane protein assembly factor BamB family protein n=1 Tax=Mycolicibacterium sediminis TaxID=1286180 RepID=UPI0013D00046|nr:PQQ-binding-like beta-propeller repeat protein [Mycolicibacterium sediminis]
MGATKSDEQTTDAPPNGRLGAALAATAGGLALGAAGIAAYAYTHGVPPGLISDRLGPATTLLTASLVAACLTAVVILALGVRALRGPDTARAAAATLAVLAAVTAFTHLNSIPADRASSLAGPGVRPILPLMQAGWLLSTCAALALLAGSVAMGSGKRPLGVGLLPWVALGAAVAVVAGSGLSTVATRGTDRSATATAIAVPPVPTTVGDQVAYSVVARRAGWVTPAGAGFVARTDDALVAFDGATGAQRWRFPFLEFPAGCQPVTVRSTGSGPDAVVLIECRREYSEQYMGGTDPHLVALDAMTGEVLWFSDDGWYLQGRVQASPDALPVRRGDDIGSLDAHTGQKRWTRPLAEDEKCTSFGDDVTAVAHSVVVVAQCADTAALHLFDGHTGQQRDIDLRSAPGGLPEGDVQYDLVAAEGDVVAIKVDPRAGADSVLLAVDTRAGTIERVPATAYLSDVISARTGAYPGAVLQLDDRHDPAEQTGLYLVGQRKVLSANDVETQGDNIPTGLRWALVGDRLVSAMGYYDDPALLVVAPDGTVDRRPSPCGTDVGGVVTVPGALLVLCERGDGNSLWGYDVLALR